MAGRRTVHDRNSKISDLVNGFLIDLYQEHENECTASHLTPRFPEWSKGKREERAIDTGLPREDKDFLLDWPRVKNHRERWQKNKKKELLAAGPSSPIRGAAL